jgi:hypothetical protein
MCDCPNCSNHTLKGSGAAYSFKDRGGWNAEEHAIAPYGLPPWYLHVPGVAHGEKYILEPQFSQSDLRALLSEHDYEEWMDTKYECAVVGDAMGIDPRDVNLKLLGKEPVLVATGNVLHPVFDYGGVTTVPYNEKECGMSKDCLIALEQYYTALNEADKEYVLVSDLLEITSRYEYECVELQSYELDRRPQPLRLVSEVIRT